MGTMADHLVRFGTHVNQTDPTLGESEPENEVWQYGCMNVWQYERTVNVYMAAVTVCFALFSFPYLGDSRLQETRLSSLEHL